MAAMRRPVLSAVMLVASTMPLAAQTEQALLADGAFEMITWTTDQPDEKFHDVCTVVSGAVNCSMQKQLGVATLSSTISGTLRGGRIASRAHLHMVITGGDCRYVSDTDMTGTIVLTADGRLSNTWTTGPATNSSVTGACAATLPRTSPAGPPSHWVGTWRQLVTVVPTTEATAAPATTVLLAADGRRVTIDLSQWQAGNLTVEQMELARQFTMKAPDGAPYALEAWRYPGMQANGTPVFVPMPRLDDTIVASAQGAAAWVKANPGKASLAALSLAVSIAMPYTVAFQASSVGMTFVESAGIGFMTSATPAAVQTLVTSALSGEGFWRSGGKAALSGAVAGAESLIGTTVGSGVTGAAETGAALTQRLVGAQVSEEAVKGFGVVASGIAGSATDLGVGVLHDQYVQPVVDGIGKLTFDDMAPPVGRAPAGGIVLPMLSRTGIAR